MPGSELRVGGPFCRPGGSSLDAATQRADERVAQGRRLDRLRRGGPRLRRGDRGGRRRRGRRSAAQRRRAPPGSRRSARGRRGPASGGRPRRHRTPTRRPLPRRAPRRQSPGAVTAMPRCSSWATRIRRFVGLSSTTSTRRPVSSTGATGCPAPAPSPTTASASGTRIVSVNVLPSPGMPLLSATSEPSISSARRRLIARPRPVPPNRRAIDASAWLNDWNSRPIRSAGMPIPVSGTASRISHVASAGRAGGVGLARRAAIRSPARRPRRSR